MIKFNRIYTWSTFEDAMPKEVVDKWIRIPVFEMSLGPAMFKCEKHDTLFNREEEPCWACYNPYE